MSASRTSGLDLSGSKPLGQPPLAPTYDVGPYRFRRARCLMLVGEAEPSVLAEAVPCELEPLPGNALVWALMVCPEVSGLGPHSFAMPTIPCRYGNYIGQFVPYLYTSTEASLTCYREVQGWPARLGEAHIEVTGNVVTGTIVRRGHVLAKAEAMLSDGPLEQLEQLPVILYKEIPGIDGRTRDVARLVTCTSLLENVELRAGRGTLTLSAETGDPAARLTLQRVDRALYGFIDDLYPDSIRVLHDYEHR